LPSLASVSQLRWDHANLSRSRDMSESYLCSILQQLINLENYSGCNVESLELIYRQIVDALKRTSDETIPTCKMNFFKFWWDQDLDDLKSQSVVSCNIWNVAGRPRSGPIFRNYRRDKSAYRYGIRSKRISDTEVYTNELHEALMEKQGASFWKCWKSKFEKGGRSLNSVNGITDNSVIAEHFVSHFSKSCRSNNLKQLAG